MRTPLTVTAIVVFVASTGLLEIVEPPRRPLTALPPAMGLSLDHKSRRQLCSV